jgi:hypothetical protein
MSLIKNPMLLAILAFVIVFAIMYYWYNYTHNKKHDNDKDNDSKNKKKKKKEGINETIVISSAIAGLLTWYIASSYFNEKTTNDEAENVENPNEVTDNKTMTRVNAMNNNGNPVPQLEGGKVNSKKVPHISSDDPTRSYNLIGSGLDIPRSELKIPNVLIDYR